MGPELGLLFAKIGVAGFVICGLVAFGFLREACKKQDEFNDEGKLRGIMLGCVWFFGIFFVLLSLAFGSCGVAYLTGQVK